MRISDWSSDVCSSDLHLVAFVAGGEQVDGAEPVAAERGRPLDRGEPVGRLAEDFVAVAVVGNVDPDGGSDRRLGRLVAAGIVGRAQAGGDCAVGAAKVRKSDE